MKQAGPDSVIIRGYRKTDLKRLEAMTALCFEGVSIDHNIERCYGVIVGRGWRWRKKRDVARDAAANPRGLFVAEVDGKPVGYISTRLDRGAAIGGIPNMVVLPKHRGRGIAKQLVQRALAHLAAEGMQYARIETLVQNAVGMRFYPKVGFREVARQVHFIMPIGKGAGWRSGAGRRRRNSRAGRR